MDWVARLAPRITELTMAGVTALPGLSFKYLRALHVDRLGRDTQDVVQRVQPLEGWIMPSLEYLSMRGTHLATINAPNLLHVELRDLSLRDWDPWLEQHLNMQFVTFKHLKGIRQTELAARRPSLDVTSTLRFHCCSPTAVTSFLQFCHLPALRCIHFQAFELSYRSRHGDVFSDLTKVICPTLITCRTTYITNLAIRFLGPVGSTLSHTLDTRGAYHRCSTHYQLYGIDHLYARLLFPERLSLPLSPSHQLRVCIQWDTPARTSRPDMGSPASR